MDPALNPAATTLEDLVDLDLSDSEASDQEESEMESSSDEEELMESRHELRIQLVQPVESQKILSEQPTTPGPFEIAISKLPKDLLKPINVTDENLKAGDDFEAEPDSRTNVTNILPWSSPVASSRCLSGLFGFFRLKPKPKRRGSPWLIASTALDGVKFVKFEKLPLELQIKIWNHAIADIEPRMVTFTPKSGKVPALLHSCHNAREEAKKVFSTVSDLGLKAGQRTGFEALIRYDTDMVYLREMKYTTELGHNPLTYAMEMHPGLLLSVKKLAIKLQRCTPDDFNPHGFTKRCFWVKLAKACPLLEEVIFDTEGLMCYSNNPRHSAVDWLRLAKLFSEWLNSSYQEARKVGVLPNLLILALSGLDGRQSDSILRISTGERKFDKDMDGDDSDGEDDDKSEGHQGGDENGENDDSVGQT